MREDVRTKRALSKLVGNRTVTMKALATDLGVSYRTLANWCEPGGTVPTLAQVRQVVWAAAAYDRAFAAELASEVFGLGDAGFLVTQEPQVKPTAREVIQEAMEATGAMGQVATWVASATADGAVQPSEADVGERIVAHALQQLAELKEATARCRAPQLAWRLSPPVTA